jgi:hypothetical protein
MHEIWYAIVVFMLTAYVLLDGFDFGAGALHWFVARTDGERREVLAAIGPFWDGNEVWLLAAGGALFVGFPRVLASGVSGFYFAIFLVLWSLILRGISMEFRSHVRDTVWRQSWDFFFSVASVLLPVFFGAALGNLLRGLPLTADGWFELDLFTDFTARAPVGILDWYTVLVGVFALAAVTAHGGTFLVWKTSGAVQARSRAAARRLYGVAAGRGGARGARRRVPGPARRPGRRRVPRFVRLPRGPVGRDGRDRVSRDAARDRGPAPLPDRRERGRGSGGPEDGARLVRRRLSACALLLRPGSPPPPRQGRRGRRRRGVLRRQTSQGPVVSVSSSSRVTRIGGSFDHSVPCSAIW